MIAFVLLAAELVLDWNLVAHPRGPWREVSYRGHTAYVAQADSSERYLHAEARGTNSALFFSIPSNTQVSELRWRWRVLRHPAGANTTLKRADDRAAAVFVLVHRSIFPWRTRGLLYQWANGGECGRWTSSPYARGIKVITLENAPADSVWRSERRNLREDLKAAFESVPADIEAIGVLCDADNTGDRAIADFGSLRLMTMVEHR